MEPSPLTGKLLDFLLRHRRLFSPMRVVALCFLAVILLGALLLSLPISTRQPGNASFLTSLFTATSATCVTGLVLQDTATYWSLFGQIVILLLIQIGGLGFMSVAAIFSFLLHRKIGLRQRLLMVNALNLTDITGVVRLVRRILLGTAIAEFSGAAVLTFRYLPEYGLLDGFYRGLFHAVSAFCNAGFDLNGSHQPFSSLETCQGDVVIQLTLLFLLILGSVGFFVWEDVLRHKRFRPLRLHSKLTLVTTALLLLGGTVCFYFFERANPATLGQAGEAQKWMMAGFQSGSARTAGFSVFPQNAQTGPSKALSLLLMFIGGSPGSTSGGVKTITVAVLALACLAVIRGRHQVSAFGRGVGRHQVLAALALFTLFFAVLIAFFLFICAVQPGLSASALFYETVSAIGTSGSSLGITPLLVPAAQFAVMLLMYFGRVGILTLSVALLLRRGRDNGIRYPESTLIMG